MVAARGVAEARATAGGDPRHEPTETTAPSRQRRCARFSMAAFYYTL